MALSWSHGITGQPISSNHGGEETYVDQIFAEQLHPNDIHHLRGGQNNGLLDLYWRLGVPCSCF